MRELKQNWKDIFLGFKIAKDPWKVILGLGCVLLLSLGYWAIHALCRSNEEVAAFLMAIILAIGVTIRTAKSEGQGAQGKIIGVAVTWAILLGLAALFSFAPGLNTKIEALASGVWALLVLSLFGGAIARSAAVELATDDRISISEAFNFARKKYFSFLFAPLMPVIVLLFVWVCVLLAHALVNITGIGVFFALILTPLMLLGGFIVVVVGIGLVFGLPLMFPTIGAEGTDSFDAISRAYSYVFMRPGRYIWYMFVACIYGMVICLFLSLFAKAGLYSVEYFGKSVGKITCAHTVWPNVYRDINKGMGAVTRPWEILHRSVVQREDVTGVFSRASRRVLDATHLSLRRDIPKLKSKHKPTRIVISMFVHVYVGIFVALMLSLEISLATIDYFLLRKDVDGNDMTEVYLEEEEDQDEPLKDALAAAEEAKADEEEPSEEADTSEEESEEGEGEDV